MKRMEALIVFACCVVVSLVMWAALVHAAEGPIKLGWNYDNPPADLAGFRVYASTTAGGQALGPDSTDLLATLPHDPGTTEHTAQATLTVPGGEETEMFFIVTAYDTSGNESGPSNEVSKVFDFKAPPNVVEIYIVTD